MRKLKKLLPRLCAILLSLWGLYFLLHLSDNVKETLTEKSNYRPNNPDIYHTNLDPRDEILQNQFQHGQNVINDLKNARPTPVYSSTPYASRNNLPDFIYKETPKGSGLLDDLSRKLIYAGLLVPRWELLEDEVPSIAHAPGEMGAEVITDVPKLSSIQKSLYNKLMLDNAFNGYASNKISLHRTLPDTRNYLCKKEDYSNININTSVIVIFHNENWQVLLRTVHSVFDRSPPAMLHEVILVDDYSDRQELKSPLDTYMQKMGKVKIVRASKRQGLIRARIMGAEVATGAVLTFLDSHCECTKGWIQPLLKRIQSDPTNVVTPVIDVIHENTFKYMFSPAEATNLGGFDWKLTFTWHPIPPDVARKRKSVIEPLRSPTMAGGLFSIDRNFFNRIGTYDPGMEVWGGENLELSFRVWMCGGRLEIMQCSHVGHIFRKRSPYKWTVGNALRRNSVRTALVWMDGYKEIYFNKTYKNYGDYGDITERQELRQRLKCKSFEWYLHNIYPEQFVPTESLAFGQIKSKLKNPKTGDVVCLEVKDKSVRPMPCGQNNQNWHLTKKSEIFLDSGEDTCMDFAGSALETYACHGLQGNQEWVYREDNMIMHALTQRCIELSRDFSSADMVKCLGTETQLWSWQRRRTV